MNNLNWKEQFPKGMRIGYENIVSWLKAEVKPFFSEFCKIMWDQYKLRALRTWTNKDGWKYKYGSKGFVFFSDVTFSNNIFYIEGIRVNNKRQFIIALEKVNSIYTEKYSEYLEYLEARKKKLNEKRKEKPNAKQIQSLVNLNQCKWPKKIKRDKILKLYSENAKMIFDDQLVDEIGYDIYFRCIEAKEIMEYLFKNRIKCTNCKNILDFSKIIDIEKFGKYEWKKIPVKCKCGLYYTYNGYKTSYRKNNMPRGGASKYFDQFILDWELSRTKEYAIKMQLIDNLIHEFHISSITGNKGRCAGENMIEGNKWDILNLINKLAYE
jgi:hypothetical protein